MQLPPLQYWPRGQVVPQAPQFRGSVASVVQLPLQLVWPGRQAHWAFWHTPLWQKLPQLPQL